MNSELIKELYDSIEIVNKTILDDELTDYTKELIIKIEENKQKSLRQFLEQINESY